MGTGAVMRLGGRIQHYLLQGEKMAGGRAFYGFPIFFTREVLHLGMEQASSTASVRVF